MFSRGLSISLALLLLLPPLAYAQEQADRPASVAAIDVQSAQDIVATSNDAVILDVRTPLEFRQSHIAGAVNADVQDPEFAAMLARLDPDKTYIVHCTKNPAGGRSSRALEQMRALGFRKLYSLEGGFVAWQAAELPRSDTTQ